MLPVILALATTLQGEFAARVEPAPSPGPSTLLAIMMRAAPDVRAQVDGFVPASAEVFSTIVTTFGSYRPRLVLADLGAGGHWLFSDFDGDGVIRESERLVFAPGDVRPQMAEFVVPGWHYRRYPLTFADPRQLPNRSAQLPPSRTVTVTSEVVVRGRVTVQGRDVLFLLAIDTTTGAPTSKAGRQFMDTDGDGAIDTDYRSPETVWARGTAAMFRVGESHLSLKSIELETGRAIFQSHAPKDYVRFELRVGAELPDFSFVDFNGRSRRLSDFRGKFVLLDFWGTWCGPCLAQLPFLEAAYDAFRSKGFEIVGMNSEHPNATPADLAAGVAKARAFAESRGLKWTNAQEPSIKTLTANSFLVETWPTTILIDREGRIVSVDRTDLGQPSLRGDELSRTLAKLIVK